MGKIIFVLYHYIYIQIYTHTQWGKLATVYMLDEETVKMHLKIKKREEMVNRVRMQRSGVSRDTYIFIVLRGRGNKYVEMFSFQFFREVGKSFAGSTQIDSSTGGRGQKSECTPREWVQKLAMATNTKLWRTTKVWLR